MKYEKHMQTIKNNVLVYKVEMSRSVTCWENLFTREYKKPEKQIKKFKHF